MNYTDHRTSCIPRSRKTNVIKHYFWKIIVMHCIIMCGIFTSLSESILPAASNMERAVKVQFENWKSHGCSKANWIVVNTVILSVLCTCANTDMIHHLATLGRAMKRKHILKQKFKIFKFKRSSSTLDQFSTYTRHSIRSKALALAAHCQRYNSLGGGGHSAPPPSKQLSHLIGWPRAFRVATTQ